MNNQVILQFKILNKKIRIIEGFLLKLVVLNRRKKLIKIIHHWNMYLKLKDQAISFMKTLVKSNLLPNLEYSQSSHLEY